MLEENAFSSDDLIQVLMIMKSNTTLSLMAIDHKLLQKPVKEQLAMFNRRRKLQLKLDIFQSFRFGGLFRKFSSDDI